MNLVKGIGTFILVVGVLLGLTWAVQGNSFFMYEWFAPRYEAVRRETFEQSHAYRQGMIQELQNMQFQYVQASPEHRAGLASIILLRLGDVPDPETLLEEGRLTRFAECVRGSQNSGDFSSSCAST